jgi:hypothetical protein
MNSLLVRTGKQVWCDKSPVNLGYIRILTQVFPEARFIYLFRECLDTAYSCLTASGIRGVMKEHRPYVAKYPENLPLAMVENWIDKTEWMLEAMARFNVRSVRVRYEDLVSDPESELQRVIGFLGLGWERTLLEKAFTVRHLPGGGDVKILDQRSIHRGSVGTGRLLPRSMLPTLTIRRANHLLAALGYQQMPSRKVTAKDFEKRFAFE